MNKKLKLALVSVFSILAIALFVSFSNPTYADVDPVGAWAETTSLPLNNVAGVTAAKGNNLYMIGGAADGAQYDQVYSASASGTGTLSSWTARNSMPQARWGMAKAQDGDRVYILGGLGNGTFNNNVFYGTVHSDGTMDNWQETTTLPLSVVEAESTIVGNWIYYAGGVNNAEGKHDTVYVSQINSNGTLGSWSTTTSLPHPMVTFGMVSYQNKIYIIGGYTNSGGINEVYSATVNTSDGTLSSWQPEESLLHEFYDKNQTVIVGNTIVIAGGGRNGNPDTSDVYYTTINNDGSLAPWQQSANSLPRPRTSASLQFVNGYLYMLGGVDNGYHTTVYYAPFLGVIPSPTPTLTPTPTSAPVTTSLNINKDTYVKSGNPNQNEGASTVLRVRANGNNRGILQVSESAIESAIGTGTLISAKIRLTIADNGNGWGGSGRTLDVHRLTSDWTEGNGNSILGILNFASGSGATWNCATDSNIANSVKNCSGSTEWEMGQSSGYPWDPTPSDTKTIINNQTGNMEFDVTADVASYLSGTNANDGWVIKKTNENQSGSVDFGSRESSSIPQLIITYQP